MKLLVVCSSLDLAMPLSATPAWWQLLKGLHALGVDLLVTTYQGAAISSPWWRAYPNPARLEGDLFFHGRKLVRRFSAPRAHAGRAAVPASGSANLESPIAALGETASQRATRRLAHAIVAPRWERHLRRILDREPDVDAVLFVSVPPNHLRGVATSLRDRYRRPVVFYDGDVPASLPAFQGFATGFRIYDGAEIAEFDAVLSNSEGGADALRAMGARAVHTLHYGADPDVYTPLPATPDIDAFFYGHTAEYRSAWLHAMIAAPSIAMTDARFAVRGSELGDLGRAETLPYGAFNHLPSMVARSRINLVVVREPHATTFASSTMRPFELAMMSACMVCNPYAGVERWFDPDKEIVIVHSADEATDRYRFLLAHDTQRRAIGAAARRRALADHTYRHRAASLLDILAAYV